MILHLREIKELRSINVWFKNPNQLAMPRHRKYACQSDHPVILPVVRAFDFSGAVEDHTIGHDE
jgi:hypothetical protein